MIAKQRIAPFNTFTPVFLKLADRQVINRGGGRLRISIRRKSVD